jgi:predicted DNA-binding transcriptional regulator YafY
MKKPGQAKLKRARRMIELYLLLRIQTCPLRVLEKRFKVNRRSILRDLQLLRDAGAHINHDELGYYVDRKKDYEKI